MVRALFVGRFQPVHMGHMEAINYAMGKADELVIVIGSAQRSHSLTNPFTAGERAVMVRAALNEAGIEPTKYQLIPVPDAVMHSVWVAQVIAYTPPFSIVYTNEPLTSRLFRECKIYVEGIPFFHRDVYSATEVRRRMVVGEDWWELLPSSVAKAIKDIGGVERLRELNTTDREAITSDARKR